MAATYKLYHNKKYLTTYQDTDDTEALYAKVKEYISSLEGYQSDVAIAPPGIVPMGSLAFIVGNFVNKAGNEERFRLELMPDSTEDS